MIFNHMGFGNVLRALGILFLYAEVGYWDVYIATWDVYSATWDVTLLLASLKARSTLALNILNLKKTSICYSLTLNSSGDSDTCHCSFAPLSYVSMN